jgi:ketosteroid isomerase-like protein
VSAENVEVVRSIVRSFYPGPDVDVKALLSDDEAAVRWIDAVTPLVDPSFRGTIRLPGLAPVTFVGLDGLRDVWQRWHTQWASFRLEAEDVIDGGERVVVVDCGYGRRETDAPEEMIRRAGIWTVRDGRVLHLDVNVPVAEALAAVAPTT